MDIDWDSLTTEQQASILAMPAGKAPNGFKSQLDNPSNRNTMCLAVVAVALFLCTAVVLIRVYSKVICAKKVRTEDGEKHGPVLYAKSILTTYVVFGLLAYVCLHDAKEQSNCDLY